MYSFSNDTEEVVILLSGSIRLLESLFKILQWSLSILLSILPIFFIIYKNLPMEILSAVEIENLLEKF